MVAGGTEEDEARERKGSGGMGHGPRLSGGWEQDRTRGTGSSPCSPSEASDFVLLRTLLRQAPGRPWRLEITSSSSES